jgi:hypothetical protein
MTQACRDDRLDGVTAIAVTAGLCHRKAGADPVLAPYFEAADMTRRIAKQAAFLTMASAPGVPLRHICADEFLPAARAATGRPGSRHMPGGQVGPDRGQ